MVSFFLKWIERSKRDRKTFFLETQFVGKYVVKILKIATLL